MREGTRPPVPAQRLPHRRDRSPVELKRTTCAHNRLLDFFTSPGLTKQLGAPQRLWPLVLLNELAANGLDGCESAGIAPKIRVALEPDTLSIWDNGPGLPPDTLERSLDYAVRVSDKAHYVSPSRGQQGNALKCLWAAPTVAVPGCGSIEVTTFQARHRIRIALDRIAQAPRLEHTIEAEPTVKNGTIFRIEWPDIARYLNGDGWPDLYNEPCVADLLVAYALFNPHLAVRLEVGDAEPIDLGAGNATWEKWCPSNPTSPHWYSNARFTGLIAAYVNEERETGRCRTVREFVSEFAGLSASAKQKSVTEAAGLSRATLADMVEGGDIAPAPAARLLSAMQAESRPVKPAALGIIGEAHLTTMLAAHLDVEPDSIQYAKVAELADGLPFVLEAAFGVYREGAERDRTLITGVNWMPYLQSPFPRLYDLFGEARVEEDHWVAVVVHLACPRLDYLDPGKTQLDLPPAIRAALRKVVTRVTRDWTQEQQRMERAGQQHARSMERLRKARQAQLLNYTEASFQVMPEVYRRASDDGQLPAQKRYMMYVCRELIMPLTGGKCWKDDDTFLQKILPAYLKAFPEQTADWEIIADPRGHLTEPHTDVQVELGTLQVREHITEWNTPLQEMPEVTINSDCSTIGPAWRYRVALFCEKEGFDRLFESARIRQRFDCALLSTKGQSNFASRELIERLAAHGVTILVLHDFDPWGFSIFNTLRTGGERGPYRWGAPRLIRAGLSLEQVQRLELQGEPYDFGKQKKDPRLHLRECGATEAEIDYLVRGQNAAGQWVGRRVELNGMSSRQIIDLTVEALTAAGGDKFVPADQALDATYRRAWRGAVLEELMTKAEKELALQSISVPGDLEARVRQRLNGTEGAWDETIVEIAREDRMRSLGLTYEAEGND